MKHSLGIRIRGFRQARHLTQEQVAEAVERTPEAISNIERGQSRPSLDTLERLSKVLSVPMAEFFEKPEDDTTRQRLEQETRLRALAQSLSDEDLEIALGQAEILFQVRSRAAKAELPEEG